MAKETLQVRRRTATVLLALVFVAGGVAGSLAAVGTKRSLHGATRAGAVLAAGATVGRQVSFTDGFAPAVDRALPAVVNIASSKIVRMQGSPFFSDPFFRQFFGNGLGREFSVPREQRERSLGSGVIVRQDGYVLTNNHVVQGASEIKVFLSDKREYKARIIGTDSKTDLAVVKVDAKDLPVVSLGDSSKVRVGDFALAIGNPFGVGETVTMGIISAKGRGGLGIEDYEDFLQTDASINPGNSGGALVNVNGQLVGINTAILTGGSGGSQGVGFAIPVNMARQVMDQILQHGKVTRGWLGVTIQPVTPAIAKAFKLSEAQGALVADVRPDSPAARSGLVAGDVILALDGAPITDSRELSLKISMTAPGTTVRLKVSRNGSVREVPVTLGEMPAQPQRAANAGGGTGPRLGVAVEDLTPQIARQLGLSARTTGVVITDVDPGSAAEEAGLQRGDVIQEVNRKPVTTVNEFRRVLQQAGNQQVLLLIDRNGEHLFVAIETH